MTWTFETDPTSTNSWLGAIRKAAIRSLDMIVPPQCLLCETQVERGQSAGLCSHCHYGLTLIADPVHPITGAPLPFAVDGDALTAFVLLSPPVWRKARAAVIYEGTGRDLVHALKYRDSDACARVMARLMVRAGRELLLPESVIVPVPLHWRRMVSRQYNQSELLAQEMGLLTGLAVSSHAVVRTRATRSQVGLDEPARRRNVGDAFSVPDRSVSDIRGKSIVLVDDVMTTGATAEAAAKALLSAGAVCVDVVTFAGVGQDHDLS